MAITTHYGNVPIAPTNVATDSVRNENEHKKPIPPAKSVSDIHVERAIDPEKEHDAEQGQHQHHHQQQPEPEFSEQAEADISTELTSSATTTQVPPIQAALKRSDIHIGAEPPVILEHEPETQKVTPADAKDVRRQLSKVYQDEDYPKPKAMIDETL
ncbi:hypothetical protein D5018_07605 [Parashewanella curva]|uniref:Uncharacterized protein n=1 Tax=Parashewanella curva TaxID=2338552 RepID=A0A3L8PY48_9GAMM|nr:hypothetical protein [Parashewanella curva]RLV60254.1 hypothetical protein D5018_07605 [Parashewanella curva]